MLLWSILHLLQVSSSPSNNSFSSATVISGILFSSIIEALDTGFVLIFIRPIFPSVVVSSDTFRSINWLILFLADVRLSCF